MARVSHVHDFVKPHSYPPGTPYSNNGFNAQQLNSPAPPHSLAPVAMPMTDPSMSMSASSSGMKAQSRNNGASVTAGVSILVVGALVGALVGVGMRVRQNGADEAAAAAQQEAPLPVAVAPGPVATQVPPQVPAVAYAANVVPGSVIPDGPPPVEDSKIAAKKGSKQRTAVVVAPRPVAQATPATKVATPTIPAPVKEKALAPTPAKAPKAEKEPADKAGAGKKTNPTDSAAAVNALKAAQGETSNSL